MTTDAARPRQGARAIAAAVAGTVFEWFDFFLYGSLAVVFGRQFFPPGHETAGLLSALAVFGAGWVVRPLGALVFGRLGDRIGRRRTFLITIVLMGIATVGIGVLPTYAKAGLWRRRCWWRCGCCRASPWAASSAARRPTWPSIPRRRGAGSTPRW